MYRTLDMAQWLAVELQSLIPAGYQNLIYHSSPKKPRNALKNVILQKEYEQKLSPLWPGKSGGIHSTLHLKNTMQSANY